MGLFGQPGDQDFLCHLILVQFSFGIYESSCQSTQEGHKFNAALTVYHSRDAAQIIINVIRLLFYFIWSVNGPIRVPHGKYLLGATK